MTDTVEIVERKPRVGGFWTKDNLALLREMLEVQGMTGAEAGVKFGKSKNAILGVADRQGIKLKGRSYQQTRRVAERPRTKPGPRPGQQNPRQITRSNLPARAATPPRDSPRHVEHVQPEALKRFNDGVSIQQRRRLYQLEHDECHWAVGEDAGGHWFCGRKVAGHKHYCAFHARAARP